MEKKQLLNKNQLIFGIALIIAFILFGLMIKAAYSQENYLLKTILLADINLVEISTDGLMAEQYYAEAGFAYENGDYNSVERECRIAREYYFKESQGYKRIKAELKSTGIEDKLIILYIDELEELIEITNNMFEACEYFESAARYYDMNNYDMGNSEIEGMNEKIKAHDKAVERYNNLLEEFRVELKKRI